MHLSNAFTSLHAFNVVVEDAVSDKNLQKYPDMSDKTLGERLDYALRDNKLTQTQLAKKIGTTQQTISRWKTGEVERPRLLREVALALNVSPAWLQFGIAELDELDKDSVELALVWQHLPEPYKSQLRQAILGMASGNNPPSE